MCAQEVVGQVGGYIPWNVPEGGLNVVAGAATATEGATDADGRAATGGGGAAADTGATVFATDC